MYCICLFDYSQFVMGKGKAISYNSIHRWNKLKKVYSNWWKKNIKLEFT